MKHIRNPIPYWIRLTRLINEIAAATKQHKPRKHLQAEARMIRTILMDWDNRQDRNYGAGDTQSGSSRLGFQKDSLRPGAGVQTSLFIRSRLSA